MAGNAAIQNGCQAAVLSEWDTNDGPHQRRERPLVRCVINGQTITIKRHHLCRWRLGTGIQNAVVLLLSCCLAAAVTAPGPACGQTAEDFDKLDAQCWKLIGAGRYAEAEQSAERLRRWAQGPLAEQPIRLATACNTLGVIRINQGRYHEAEPLCKQALEIRRRLLGPTHRHVAASFFNVAEIYREQARLAEAEPLYKQALRIDREILGPEHSSVADSLNGLANLYTEQGRYAEAEQSLKDALNIRRKRLGDEHRNVADNLNNLACLYHDLSRYAEAARLHEQALEIRRKKLGDEHPLVAGSLSNLACVYNGQGRYAEAERLSKEALQIRQKRLGDDHPDLASSVNALACSYLQQGRYIEAERLQEQSLETTRRALGSEHPRVAASLNNLASVYLDQGRYEKAEPLLVEALRLRRQTLGDEHSTVAQSLNNLASLYWSQGRYGECEPLDQEALAIRRNVFGDESPVVAESLDNMACVYLDQGRYSEAEPFFRRALGVSNKLFGGDHPNVATHMNGLGRLYLAQKRYAEAESYFTEALRIRRKVFGSEHPNVAAVLNNLAVLHMGQRDFADAESLHKEDLRISRKWLGDADPTMAIKLNNLANLYDKQGRHAEAEPLVKEALEIRRKALGDTHPDLAGNLHDLACHYRILGQFDEAEELAREARAIAQIGVCRPMLVAPIYWNLARIYWETDRRGEAIHSLEEALRALEKQRETVSGGDLERAQYFGGWNHWYSLMVAWQRELGRLGEVFQTMERARARTFLDQMRTVGLDLLADLPEEEAEILRQKESQAAGRVAAAQKQLEVLHIRRDFSPQQKEQERERLLAELNRAQFAYTRAYADIRNASPAYRLAVRDAQKPVSFDHLALWASDQRTLVLEYLLGREGGYVLVVPPGGSPRVNILTLDDAQAKLLGVEPGPLTADRMENVLRREDGTGVLQQLRDPAKANEAADRRAALWKALVPAPEHVAILQGAYQRLVVLPDPSLAQLPFETLIVQAGDDPKYLLDVGPPILYAPSATILMNLAERESASGDTTRPALLTIGDCRYDEGSHLDDADVLAQLAPGSRYTSVGGRLAPLPYSAREVQWVADVFQNQGVSVAWLKDDWATEETVRHNVSDRRIVHFACHGLVDQEYGNLFGALALTPGPKADDPNDDGFLTLAEIYELNLKGCELAILSACDTNYGPHQRGEGVWALSRGFLVAGSRRVVASNWLVDDEAAPNLMSYFCSILAKAEAAGEKPDYAEALWKAKRWLRSREQWQSPYYWGSFVLIGPS